MILLAYTVKYLLDCIQYRVVGFGSEGCMDPLGGTSNMSTTSLPALINGSSGDGAETRLALITSNDTSNDSTGAVVVSGGNIFLN